MGKNGESRFPGNVGARLPSVKTQKIAVRDYKEECTTDEVDGFGR